MTGGTDMLARLAVALAVGLLVGLERGWQARAAGEGRRAAGLRTFALTGLLGGVSGAIGSATSPIVLGFAFLGFAIAFTVFAALEARADADVSATTAVAGLVTFAVGAYAALGEVQVAVAAGVATTVLLAMREPLHQWIARLSFEEIRAILTLAAMTFLALPVLPDRAIDPLGAVNPREIWLLAILIAGLSFVGYVAVRLFGDRLGILLAAVAGGLASSTATTVALARLGHDRPEAAPVLAAGILASGAVMVARVGMVLTAIAPALLPAAWPPLAALAGVLAVGALVTGGWRRPTDGVALTLTNPLDLATALKLALLIAIVGLATAWLGGVAGGGGVYVIAALSGIVDVDAATISMGRMSHAGLAAATAVAAVLTTVAVNTVAKSIMAGWIGGTALGIRVGAVGGVGILAAAGTLLALG